MKPALLRPDEIRRVHHAGLQVMLARVGIDACLGVGDEPVRVFDRLMERGVAQPDEFVHFDTRNRISHGGPRALEVDQAQLDAARDAHLAWYEALLASTDLKLDLTKLEGSPSKSDRTECPLYLISHLEEALERSRRGLLTKIVRRSSHSEGSLQLRAKAVELWGYLASPIQEDTPFRLPVSQASLPQTERILDPRLKLIAAFGLFEHLVRTWKPEWFEERADFGRVIHARARGGKFKGHLFRTVPLILTGARVRNELLHPKPGKKVKKQDVYDATYELLYQCGLLAEDTDAGFDLCVVQELRPDQWPYVDEASAWEAFCTNVGRLERQCDELLAGHHRLPGLRMLHDLLSRDRQVTGLVLRDIVPRLRELLASPVEAAPPTVRHWCWEGNWTVLTPPPHRED